MNIRIGDIVKFISEKLEGKVTSLADQNTVNVYCEEYGFEIPASVNDLVVIKSDFGNVIPSDKSKPDQSINMQSTDMLYLAIVPENFHNLTDSRYTFHLVNDTALTCLYTLNYSDGEKFTGISAGNCNPDNSIQIASHSLKELDRIKSINIQAVFYQKGLYTPRTPIESHIKIIPVSLQKSGAYKHVKWFNNMAILRSLDKEAPSEEKDRNITLPEKVVKEKNRDTEISHPAKQTGSKVVEIDLHIDQLLKTTQGMENKDILDYQLDVFRKTLEEYKLRKGQKIVFIHGKGDGVLRQRLLWELQTRYKRFHHQDASFKQYGYGATMVTVK